MDAGAALMHHSAPHLAMSPTLDKPLQLQQRLDISAGTAAPEAAFGGGNARKLSEPFQLQNGTEIGEEENLTSITESMSVTTADEEKLLLLNRNTELRRINQKLMKLNQDWDQFYRVNTSELQQRVAVLQMEVSETNQHACALSKKLDSEQCKREYYEQCFVQEMKRNQQLQEYVRQLENKLRTTREGGQPPPKDEPWRPIVNDEKAANGPQQQEADQKEAAPSPAKHAAPSPAKHVRVLAKSKEQDQCKLTKPGVVQHVSPHGISQKECKELLDQMAALMCQTKLFESDYKTECKDRQHTQAENEKLKKLTEDMYLQMNLLKEQLKIYEDDFKRERSDKQILQRLLKSKSENKEPVLVHRCNNTHQKSPDIKKTPCSKHCVERHSSCSTHHRSKGAEIQAVPYSIDYH